MGKEHQLLSAIYVFYKKNLYFSEVKKAKLIFKTITEKNLNSYLNENGETALSSVGSYKIEDNEKYKFIEILSGDLETIKRISIDKLFKKMEKRLK